MGDAFEDRLEQSLDTLTQDEAIAAKIDVPPERRFVGFDAYKQVIASGVDVVLLCTPPHFRPLHLEAAVEAGKHVFAEKPVAVDAPGVRSVLATCERGEDEGPVGRLRPVPALRQRLPRDGASASTTAPSATSSPLQANDYRGADLGQAARAAAGPTWTGRCATGTTSPGCRATSTSSSTSTCLDICAWAMGDQYPVRAVGIGGRQVRTGPEYGHIYDHFAVVYEYDDGAKLFSHLPAAGGLRQRHQRPRPGHEGAGRR